MTRRTRDLIVVGASAGGVEALRDLAAGLPDDLPACLLVVLHLPPRGSSVLARILTHAGPLPAYTARDGALPEHGTIHVIPPGRHLLVVDGRLKLSERPVKYVRRNEIDVLFDSAARTAGVAMVQDPAEARYPSMPEHALRALTADHVLPAAAMAPCSALSAARRSTPTNTSRRALSARRRSTTC